MMDSFIENVAQENGKNVFKGSQLVDALVEQYNERFKSRVHATKYCQELVDGGHIESIMGTPKFLDSVNLYRWKEHSVIHDARKLVLNSGYIPKQKLMELVELQKHNSTTSSISHERKTSSSSGESNSFDGNLEIKNLNRKARIDRRQTVSVYSPEHLRAVTHKVHNTFQQSGSLSDLNRLSSMSIETLARMGHSQSERSLQSVSSTASGGTFRDFRDLKTATPPPPRHLVSEPGSPRAYSPNHKLSRSTSQGTQFRGPKDRRGICYYDGADLPAIDFSKLDFVPARPASTTNLYTNATDTVKTNTTSNKQCRPTIGESSRRGFGLAKSEKSTGTQKQHNVSGLAHKWGSVDNIVAGNINFKNNRNVNRALRTMNEFDWGSIESVASDPQFLTNFPKPGSPIRHEVVKSVQIMEDKSTAGSLEDLGNHSYSDNEKQLLENMKHMKIRHEAVVRAYETKVNELMSKMHELRGIADMLEHAGKGPSRSTSPPSDYSAGDKDSPGNKENKPIICGGAVAPPPPAPPAPPPMAPGLPRSDRPCKPMVKPRIKMRPLFWNRILITNSSEPATIWHQIREPNYDIHELERLFGKKVEPEKTNTLHDTLNKNSRKTRSQPAKILDTNRSRSVAIRLRSLHCDMSDIKRAIHDIDFSQLDIDSLQGIYDIRGTREEISSIEQYTQQHENAVLDQPEQFLLELSRMSHFADRVECLVLRKKFSESMFNIDQQLSIVKTGCKELRTSMALKQLIELILAFGNYMNGGTQRGQADGFMLNILTKLKDVKGMEANMNLHHYLMRVYIKENEENAGSNEATFQLPDPGIMQRAAQVSFKEIEADLAVMERQIKIHKIKVQSVTKECKPNLVQPFKQNMEEFFESAELMLQRQEEHFTATKDDYNLLMQFFGISLSDEKDKPDVFFSYWSKFLEDSRHFWKLEQVRTAKENFEAVERKRKERMRMMRRRSSVQDLTKPNLKDRFEQLQRQSSLYPGTGMISRSMSVNSLDKAGEDDLPSIMAQNRSYLSRGHSPQFLNSREPAISNEKKYGESIRERMRRLTQETGDVRKNEINSFNGGLKDNMRRRTTTNIYEDEEANFNNNVDPAYNQNHSISSKSNGVHQMALRTIHEPNIPDETMQNTLRRSQSLRQRFPEMDKTINRLRMGESLTDLTNGGDYSDKDRFRSPTQCYK